MSWREVIVATRLPKPFYIILKIVKGLNLDFEVCEPGDWKCTVAKVVITTKDESEGIEKKKLVLVDEKSDEISISMDIMLRYYGITSPNELIVGIDPGLHTGLTIVGDGNVLYAKTLTSPIDAYKAVARILGIILKKYATSKFIVRLGAGSKLYSTLFLRGLNEKIKEHMIELVDEKYTTFPGGYETDQTSAVLIAGRSGRTPTETDYIIEPKTGYIRALQHLFVWLTGNRNCLSIDVARSILRNEYSMEYVLNEM